jgi:hypothetical protein
MLEGWIIVDIALVAGRSCGSCNVCCVVPTIDDPALQKLPGYRCHNAMPTGACAIYEVRPHVCQSFFCGWRQLKWIGEGLRPDISGVFVRVIKETGSDRFVVVFTLLDDESLKAAGLAEAVAAATHAGIGAYLVVPGPPGYTSSRIPLNDLLGDAVGRRDKAAVLRILADLRSEAKAASANRPVILASHTPGHARNDGERLETT